MQIKRVVVTYLSVFLVFDELDAVTGVFTLRFQFLAVMCEKKYVLVCQTLKNAKKEIMLHFVFMFTFGKLRTHILLQTSQQPFDFDLIMRQSMLSKLWSRVGLVVSA